MTSSRASTIVGARPADRAQPCAHTDLPPLSPADIDAARARYAHERDRRIVESATEQYRRPTGGLAPLARTDPHKAVVPRSAIHDQCDVVVLGGGWAGILAGYHLQKAGITGFRHIEQAGDFGGVWYWNRYPGIQCDNDAYCYLPLLEETGFMPSAKFADGGEILGYAQSVARRYGLYDGALFHTIVESLEWDDAAGRLLVETDRGDKIAARFVIMANGLINTPKLPAIEGIESFAGALFHTSRWDYEYTGGSPHYPNLHRLADKRVAIVGTGATAIQAVPYLGRYAGHLYVVQRTPSCVDFRDNPKTDRAWVSGLKPGWQRERIENFEKGAIAGFDPGETDQICDIWTEINRQLARGLAASDGPEMTADDYIRRREMVDHQVMARLRERVAASVDDPATAEALKPWYRFMCKRPASNNDYYPTFNRPNVTLVDVSESKGVERLTTHGFVAGGREYPIDCMIFASGFEVTSDLPRRWGIARITGRNGGSLYDYWGDHYRTLHGIMARGFPNLMMTGFIQSGFSATTTELLNGHCEHVAYIVKAALDRGARAVEPSDDAQDEWVRHVRQTAQDMSSFARECTPGYFNGEGDSRKARWFAGEPYGPGWAAYMRLLRNWREQSTMPGLEMAL